MENKSNHGGARVGSGRKKGIGICDDIRKHCDNFINELLKDEAIRYKAVKQLSLNIKEEEFDYLYIIENNGLYKIGYSSNWRKRYKAYQTHLGFVNISYLTKQINSFKLEGELHQMFSDKRVTGEWFKLNSSDLLKAISYCSLSVK